METKTELWNTLKSDANHKRINDKTLHFLKSKKGNSLLEKIDSNPIASLGKDFVLHNDGIAVDDYGDLVVFFTDNDSTRHHLYFRYNNIGTDNLVQMIKNMMLKT